MGENEDLKRAVIDFFNTYDNYEDIGGKIEYLKEQLKENEERFRKLETKLSNISEILIKNDIPGKSIVEHRKNKYVFDLDLIRLKDKTQIADNIGNAKYFKRSKIVDLSHFS